MKRRIINENEFNTILTVLLEIPAKLSLPGIEILRKLPEYVEDNLSLKEGEK